MIDVESIKNDLELLDSEYNKDDVTTELQIIYSKMALLSLCCWIEDAFDEIVKCYIAKQALTKDIQKYIIDKCVEQNYGFNYMKNIIPMFCSTIGIANWSSIQNSVDNVEDFKSILNNLSKKRNIIAHKYKSEVMPNYDAPSTIINNFQTVKETICKIESAMNKL